MSGKKESPHRFRWGICNGRCGDCLRLCFLLSWLLTGSFRHGFHFRLFRHLFLVMLPCQFPKFFPTLRRQTHHHFIETVDGRIGIPVQCGIDVVRVGRLGGVLRFHLLILHCGFCSWSCRCNRDFRFGSEWTFVRNCLFLPSFSFLVGFRFGLTSSVHPPRG